MNNNGHLKLRANTVHLNNNADNETMALFTADGAVELFHNNSKKFETTSGGCTVTGDLLITDDLTVQDNLLMGDTDKIAMGDSSDFEIHHDGSNSYISNATGDIIIENSGTNTSNQLRFRARTGEESIVAHGNAQVELYYDNTKRFETQSSGAQVNGTLTVDGNLSAYSANNNSLGLHGHRWNDIFIKASVDLADSGQIRLGDSDDLKLYHNGSHSYIEHGGTGHLFIGPTSSASSANIYLMTNSTSRWRVLDSGHFIPFNNNTYDIGTSSNRVRNIYTNDLHLSNEGSSNDMDGSWGDWTIQEGESDLFLKNNRSGKKYKFNLTEVS